PRSPARCRLSLHDALPISINNPPASGGNNGGGNDGGGDTNENLCAVHNGVQGAFDGRDCEYNLEFASRNVEITEDIRFVELPNRSEEHTSELQSREHLVCR